MDELKKCPFCGGTPNEPYEYDPYDGYQGNNSRYVIKCPSCRVSIERKTKQEVVDAWNARVEDGKID